MATPSTRPRSAKGFVAIDIDGTALVEKIDKNPLYGMLHAESHIRQTLIEYMKAAQAEGYDIIIMTARPELVEGPLGLIPMGTKATQSIVDYLKEGPGIDIAEVARAPAGLKGKKMTEVLAGYGANAVGMLFDDQLKQVADVQKQNNPRLFAFDINGKADLEQYIAKVPLYQGTNNPFHPQNIIDSVLESPTVLNDLKNTINQMNPNTHPKEVKIANQLLDELCIRLYEAQYRNYKPEIDWVNKSAVQISNLLGKIHRNEALTMSEINKTSRAIFHCDFDKVKPNSSCDLLVHNMLKETTKYPIMHALKNECQSFQNYLNTQPSNETIDSQKVIVSNLMSNLKHPNPDTAIENFRQTLNDNKTQLRESPKGNAFVEFIRNSLAKIPGVSSLVKSRNDVLSERVESISNLYKNKLDAVKEEKEVSVKEVAEPIRENTSSYQR